MYVSPDDGQKAEIGISIMLGKANGNGERKWNMEKAAVRNWNWDRGARHWTRKERYRYLPPGIFGNSGGII